MPMSATTQVYSGRRVLPLYRASQCLNTPVNLAPSTVFLAGTVLGQVTNSANDVQTITAPGSGTYTLSGTNPVTGLTFTTTALAFNANDATVQAALIAAFGASGSGITVASLAVTFGGALAKLPVPVMVASAGSVAHTTTGRTAATFAAYASGNSDGSQTAKCILEYDCATDAGGNASVGATTAAGGPWGETRRDVPAWFSGEFDTSKLVGLDAAGAANLGRLISGTASAGTLQVGGA